MSQTALQEKSPDIKLLTSEGLPFELSKLLGRNVLIVLSRGFTWEFCQKHIAQLRDASEELAASNTLVLVVGPDSAEAFQQYWKDHNISFIGLPDPAYSVLKTFGRQAGLFKLGRVLTQLLVDKHGFVRYAHFGHQPADLPANVAILSLIKGLNG